MNKDPKSGCYLELCEGGNRISKEEWLERDPTNDAGAGKQSEKGGEKAMLQLYRRQLHPAGRAGPLPLPAADHALADLPLVSHGGSAG